MPRDALGAHARGELGISDLTAPRPIRAALASGAAFSVGGILPLALTLATPGAVVVDTVSIASLVFLAVLRAVGAKTGGAAMVRRRSASRSGALWRWQ